MNHQVEILLSTYNGEKYLGVQLDSIIQQDYTHWKLIIRDDGSKDATLSIIEEYAKKYPDKISLLKDTDGNLGFCDSFCKLLKQSAADYVMYCDQDDYWMPSKISTLLSVMMEEETLLPARAHIVFSDLQVADAELNLVSPSFFKMTNYLPNKGMQIFFLKNYVPGCNMLFNRKLIEQAMQTDNIINLHDHWLLIVCSAVGKLSFIDKPLMKYRMHDTNAIGFFQPKVPFLKQVSLFFKENLKYGLFNKKYRNLLYIKNIQQMENICERLATEVSKETIVFSKIDKSNYFVRKLRSFGKPYILENTMFKQLTYIICF
ncbi:MAG TPA: glycosyltransferase family 2 protein [Bacteroidia bacterium]|nr:glycosyltransferase family 2 protein [Bacteroidia bacterium]